MNSLIQAVQTYAMQHANSDGLVLSRVPGLSMMCLETPAGDLQSIYKPLVCLVLQGAKRMMVGRQNRVVSAGESAIVSADMPVVGRRALSGGRGRTGHGHPARTCRSPRDAAATTAIRDADTIC